MNISQIWIEDGCISCYACEPICPEVFVVGEEGCDIRGEAREDAQTNRNHINTSSLISEIQEDCVDELLDAVEACPVEVIKYA